MSRGKMVYVSEEVHRRLKLLAARRNRPMGELVRELVEQELADLANPWTSPEGLALQQQVLAQVWDDPALDVYEHD
ncbi:MAG: ribbon-helix-helix protein, CopG family [Candidatus Rokubacteria bacterium]|nr:ribbon-helix-helix protein, CopG family [Candidatus Rokubacteria bacterium]